MVKTLIMAGGIGERLWPVSVRKRPKQFQKFGSKKTMIEETIERMEKLTDEIIIITTREQFPLMQYYLPLFPS
ncbi:MAG: sugar phosphate nucleotidyltransferase, partial [Mesotoga sp.]